MHKIITSTMKTTSIRVFPNTSLRMPTVSGAVLTTTLFAAILLGGVSVQAGTFNWIGSADDNHTRNPSTDGTGNNGGLSLNQIGYNSSANISGGHFTVRKFG
jgi:hypothetical protein